MSAFLNVTKTNPEQSNPFLSVPPALYGLPIFSEASSINCLAIREDSLVVFSVLEVRIVEVDLHDTTSSESIMKQKRCFKNLTEYRLQLVLRFLH